MRRVLIGVCLLLAACGGSTPTAPTPVVPTPVPVPQYPSVTGNWGGTLVIIASAGGQNISNTCTHTWSVTSQTQWQFSGTFQTSGGTTVACGQAGTFSGSVGTDGRVTGLTYSITIGATGCSRVAGDGIFTGLLANGSVSATTSDTLTCGSVTAARNITLTMGR